MIITTKYLPATEKRGSRLQAKFCGKVLSAPYNHGLDLYENHLVVAKQVSGLSEIELVRFLVRGYEFRETEDQTCLGYKNYETAQVILQISNERKLYDRAVTWSSIESDPRSWTSLVEHLTGKGWRQGLKTKIPGTNLSWDSPLICRKEVLGHVLSMIQD